MNNLEILRFDFKINGKEYQEDVVEKLRTDRTNLDEGFAEQPILFAYFATLHEMAKDKAARLKVALETLYAQLDHEKRDIANKHKLTNPSFKYTESMCEGEIKTDQRYQLKQNELLDANHTAGVLGVAREAFQQRRDMLISLGANARASTPDLKILGDRARDAIKEESIKKVAKMPQPVVQQQIETEEEPDETTPRRKPSKTNK